MSATYFVRVKESKELVGVFIVDSIRDLDWAVDEITDPGGCEFKPAYGALVWPEAHTPAIPGSDEGIGWDLAGCEASEEMVVSFYSSTAWKDVPPRAPKMRSW